MASRKNGKGSSDVKIGAAYEREVDVDLTDEEAMALEPEHMAKLDEMDEKKEEIAAAKEEHRQAMSGHKKELRELEAEELRLRNARKTKQRRIKVQVREHMNLRTGNVEIKRVDTGEVVDERPMTAEERQTEMFALEGGKADPEASKATIADLQAEKAKRTKGKKGATPAEPSEEDFPPEAPF